MLLVLYEIQEKHGIPSGTMRSAISRGIVEAEKRGRIVMVDDESQSFLAFKASYRPRSARTSSPSLSRDGFSTEAASSVTLPQTLSS